MIILVTSTVLMVNAIVIKSNMTNNIPNPKSFLMSLKGYFNPSTTQSVMLAIQSPYICIVYNNPIDLALNMLRYGPTRNIAIAELTNAPKRNIPLAASAPKANPEIPNTVKINPISAVTTNAMTTVMIISPK